MNFSIKSAICFVLTLVFVHAVSAQSGRKTSAKILPVPTPVSNSGKAPSPEEFGTDPQDRPVDVPALTSFLVAGEVIHPYAYYSSNEIGIALKECVNALKAHRGVTSAAKLGKLQYEAAKEAAKRQTDAYVIWISFVAGDDGYGTMLIKYADYLVLSPKTGARLTFGRIKPDVYGPVATGGVLGIPTIRRQSSPVLARQQMMSIARQIPEILAHGGWLERK